MNYSIEFTGGTWCSWSSRTARRQRTSSGRRSSRPDSPSAEVAAVRLDREFTDPRPSDARAASAANADSVVRGDRVSALTQTVPAKPG